MKPFLPVLTFVILCLAGGCTTEEEEQRIRHAEDSTHVADSLQVIHEADSVRYVLEYLWKDSVQKKIHSLIKAHFVYKNQDFPKSTYYHNNWWGEYYLRADALTCVLHQGGELTIISCLDGQDAGCEHNQIVVELNGKEFVSDTAYARPPSRIIGAGNSEFASFTGDKATAIAHAIRENQNATIAVRARNNSGFCSRYTLSERDIKGIADCYELSVTMKAFYAYGAQ